MVAAPPDQRRGDVTGKPRRQPAASVGARAINRAASVLRALALQGETGCNLATVAERAGLSKSTTHRILKALVDERLVERRPHSREYRTGPEIFNFAAAAGRHLDIRVIAYPILASLRAATGCTVILAVRSGNDALCVERLLGIHAESATFDVGDRVPLGAGASSIAILAFLGKTELDEILDANAEQFAGRQQLSRSSIEGAIKAARANRIAVATYDGLNTRGVSVPVFDHRGQPIASLTISSLISHVEDVAGLGDQLWAASRSLSQRLEEEGGAEPFRRALWRDVN